MTISWPDHLLTLEEWDALPEDSTMRLELVEGVLAVSPKPVAWHQKICTRLVYRLDEQLPPELTAQEETEVLLFRKPPTVRCPDTVVMATSLYERNPGRITASDVHLAVEVLSDGTRRIDRVLKFSEYVEAGIPRYWIIDVGPPTTLLAYVLVDNAYELAGAHSGASTLEVAGHRVTIDLDTLVPR